MTALKTCFKCGIAKPRTEFYRHPAMGDGLLGKCKRCTRLDVRATRASRAEYYRAYDKDRYRNRPGRKQAAIATFKAAAAANPHRKAAANMVARAVRSGAIVPQPCWVCGEKAQAHHPDYSRPLDVVWLCVVHHRQAHGLVRRMDDDQEAA